MKKLLVFVALVILLFQVFGVETNAQCPVTWGFYVEDPAGGCLPDSLMLRPGEWGHVVAPAPSKQGSPVCRWLGLEGNDSFSFMTPLPGQSVFDCGFVDDEGNFTPEKTLYLTVAGETIPGSEDSSSPVVSGGGSGVLSDSTSCMNCRDIGRRVAIYRSEVGEQYEYRVESLVDDGSGGWEAGSTICRSSTRLVEGIDCSGVTTGGMGVEIDITLTEGDVTYVVWVGGETIVYGPYPLSVEE